MGILFVAWQFIGISHRGRGCSGNSLTESELLIFHFGFSFNAE
jgi:hypothetical protein